MDHGHTWSCRKEWPGTQSESLYELFNFLFFFLTNLKINIVLNILLRRVRDLTWTERSFLIFSLCSFVIFLSAKAFLWNNYLTSSSDWHLAGFFVKNEGDGCVRYSKARLFWIFEQTAGTRAENILAHRLVQTVLRAEGRRVIFLRWRQRR